MFNTHLKSLCRRSMVRRHHRSLASSSSFFSSTNTTTATTATIHRSLHTGGTLAQRLQQHESTYDHVLHYKRMNKKVIEAEYAVRGRLVLKAEELQKQLQDPNHDLPFDDIIFCNIGNPQALNQQPITFFRQLLSLCLNPALLSDENIETTKQLFMSDVIERAQLAIQSSPGGFGAYSHSKGLPWVRESIKTFLEERDGVSCDIEDLFLTNGASDGISRLLQLTIREPNDGVLIPIPQYPLYTATLTLLGGQMVPYYLDEANNWGLSVSSLHESVENANRKGTDVRAMCVINPGNPTGQVLSLQNMKEIIHFCHTQRLMLLADEVYQENTYVDNKPFYSFKRVLHEMGHEYRNFELASFHSTSKGFLGECGFRGGYMEVVNMHPVVKDQLYKLMSIGLCSNVPGQLMTEVMINPPKPGDASYDQYQSEKNNIIESLKRRATKLVDALNQLEGMSCNYAEGAMYIFPSIELSDLAIQKAKEAEIAPDAYYCEKLLEETGICVVPGSGFGQQVNTWHFRMTFLPEENKMDQVIERISHFHMKFLEDHS